MESIAVGITILAILVILVDFSRGFLIHVPEPPCNYTLPYRSHWTLWMRRWIQMLCPPLGFVIEMFAVKRIRNIVFAEHEKEKIALDIFLPRTRPEGDSAPMPVFLYVHGGGWVYG